MGVLDRFEKGVERAVNGAFAKAFRSEVQPVEIASALRREVDDRAAVVGRDRTLVPNTFVVELGAADHERLGEWEEALADELATVVDEHAAQQRYVFVGPVTVTFEQAEDLDTGLFRVRSTTTKGQARPPRAAAGTPSAPAPAPPSAPVAPPAVQPPAAPAPSSLPPTAAAPAARPAPAGSRITARLDVDGRIYRVTEPVTVIGRSTEADVVLDDPGVSRRHAEIHVLDGRPRVVDLGSTNGTYLDGERVHAGALVDGSVITIGRTRILVNVPGPVAADR